MLSPWRYFFWFHSALFLTTLFLPFLSSLIILETKEHEPTDVGTDGWFFHFGLLFPSTHVRFSQAKYEAQNVEPPPPPYTPSPPTSDPPPWPCYLAYLVLHASQFNGRTSRPLHVRELRSCWFCYFKRTDEWHKFYDRTK